MNTNISTYRAYWCPCCGSQNTVVAAVEKVTYDDPTVPPSTRVEVWCYNCSDAINITVTVPKEFHPHPDVGRFNVMEPLTRFLKEQP